jgi:hypothetical protein
MFTISDFRHAMRNGAYAWPGGYPLYFVTSDGEALSFEAAKTERRAIREAYRDAMRAKRARLEALELAEAA